jgi:putative neutral zinc metallopeptidase
MTFKPDVTVDDERVKTSGNRGLVIGGSSIGALILAGILWYLGVDPGQLQDVLGTSDASTSQSASGLAHCKTGEAANKYAECRVDFTARSLDKVWGQQLPEQANLQYKRPAVMVFTNSTRSGCGVASSATGPFYCPTDQTAYFDVSFFDQLKNYGATNTPFAQEYIVAHEFGHHIQKLQNTLGMSNYNEPGPESNAVKIELQADCYAGVWAYYADKGDNALLQPITEEQLAGAINAARAVGDDNIQQRSGGEVRPDTFTHGTSEQRQEAFLAGYHTGQMSSCPL